MEDAADPDEQEPKNNQHNDVDSRINQKVEFGMPHNRSTPHHTAPIASRTPVGTGKRHDDSEKRLMRRTAMRRAECTQ